MKGGVVEFWAGAGLFALFPQSYALRMVVGKEDERCDTSLEIVAPTVAAWSRSGVKIRTAATFNGLAKLSG